MNSRINVLILAAGSGSRTLFNVSKPMLKLADVSLLQHIVDIVCRLECVQKIVIVHSVHNAFMQNEIISCKPITWVLQTHQNGTAHAVLCAIPTLCESADDPVFVLCADVPLIQESTLLSLAQTFYDTTADIAFLSAIFQEPQGFGRVIRNAENQVVAIKEDLELSLEQKNIKEINSGILIADVKTLNKYLSRIGNHNKQNEHYLTDIISLIINDKLKVMCCIANTPEDVIGINNMMQLAVCEKILQKRRARAIAMNGVHIYDLDRLDIRGRFCDIQIQSNVTIDVNVILKGHIHLASNVSVGAGCVIENTQIEQGSKILPYSVISGAKIGAECTVGPFARIRNDTVLHNNVKIGNFVELKKSVVGQNSKAAHLSYIGDCNVGKDVNVGAGSITCNYSNGKKHRTYIADKVFIGANVALVAPVTVEKESVVGAGSVITKDVPCNTLAVARGRQKNIKYKDKDKKQ